ncbi:MAG: universal stress protein [Euryarchaeota archaeon]|nr:universal stress protein [Euryarchaeota archaeon]
MARTGWYQKILLPVDGSEISKKAAMIGLDMAKLLNAEVTVISVIDLTSFTSLTQGYMLPDMFSYIDGAAEAAVKDILAEGRERNITMTPLVKRGSPAQDIIDQSRHHDLIVMGTSGRSGVSHLVLGSVAEKVVRFAECPVLVVK